MRVCAEPGCPQLVPPGPTRCPKCQAELDRKRYARQDAERPSAAARGYDERHREWRAKILKRDPVCVKCKAVPSKVADHIKPIREGGKRFQMSNGQGMCERCHNQKRQEESMRARRRQ
jgi:5-methylcytosine-specific restriction protein A